MHWDKQSKWASYEHRFLISVANALSETGVETFIKTRPHENKTSRQAEENYLGTQAPNATLLTNDYDFEVTTSEDDRCLIVSTHSSLAIDKHLEGRPVLFVNNKDCLAYDLNDFQANIELAKTVSGAVKIIQKYCRGNK